MEGRQRGPSSCTTCSARLALALALYVAGSVESVHSTSGVQAVSDSTAQTQTTPLTLRLPQMTGESVSAAFWLATEASTPLVNARALLIQLGFKDGLLYTINGIAIVVTFFVARILLSVLYVAYAMYYFEVRRR